MHVLTHAAPAVFAPPQLYALFSQVGHVARVIMGLDRNTKTPCGFCFVIYHMRSAALAAVAHLNGTKLDGRMLRVDIDYGFEDGRQFGRGRSGGQARLRLFDVLSCVYECTSMLIRRGVGLVGLVWGEGGRGPAVPATGAVGALHAVCVLCCLSNHSLVFALVPPSPPPPPARLDDAGAG